MRFPARRRYLLPGFFFCRFSMKLFDRVFYYPDRRKRTTPAEAGLAFEDVSLRAADGTALHAWLLPSRTAESRGTVLHLHGNAANITGHWPFIGWLPAAGYHVLALDYRGYGRSEGTPTREGTLLDAEAALDYLRDRPEVDPRRIFIFGQSIGGAIASVLAARRNGQLAGVIIDSAFTSYREIARYHILRNPMMLLMAWWFPFGVDHTYDPIEQITAINPTPILIMHGKADRIIPWQMSKRLYNTATGPKELWLIEDMDHLEAWELIPEEAGSRFVAFCKRALA